MASLIPLVSQAMFPRIQSTAAFTGSAEREREEVRELLRERARRARRRPGPRTPRRCRARPGSGSLAASAAALRCGSMRALELLRQAVQDDGQDDRRDAGVEHQPDVVADQGADDVLAEARGVDDAR